MNQPSLFGEDPTRGAEISTCGLYRYRLWRTWDAANPSRVAFIMLNPSTADATANDPTLRRCIDFAQRWGHGGLEVVNLFPFRAADPKEMLRQSREVAVGGPENEEAIRGAVRRCHLLVAAWGTKGSKWGRDVEVLRLLRGLGAPLFCPHCGDEVIEPEGSQGEEDCARCKEPFRWVRHDWGFSTRPITEDTR